MLILIILKYCFIRCSTSDATQTPKMRRLSFAFPVEPISPHHMSKQESGDGQGSVLDPALMSKELTCISEEGLAEIDFQVDSQNNYFFLPTNYRFLPFRTCTLTIGRNIWVEIALPHAIKWKIVWYAWHILQFISKLDIGFHLFLPGVRIRSRFHFAPRQKKQAMVSEQYSISRTRWSQSPP